MKKKYTAILTITGCTLFLPPPSGAREYSLSGSIGMYQSYDSNATREKNNQQSQWTSTIAPSLTLRSTSQFDQISFNYAPGYTYNDRTEEGNVDHQFSLAASKRFMQYLSGNLSNTFMPGETGTDRSGNIFMEKQRTYSTYTPIVSSGAAKTPAIPAETAIPESFGVIISQDRGVSRYWSNSFSVDTSYQYGYGRFFELSYANNIFDNEDPASVDYVRHMPGGMLRHRFSPQWSTDASLDFSKGEFSIGEDLTTTSPGVRINYHYSPHTSFFGDYRYSVSEYSGTRPGYDTHTPSLGYSGSLDQFTELSARLGASLTKQDNGKNNTGVNYSLSLNRRLEHGGFSISGSGGHEALNYNGVLTGNGVTEGLSQYWSINGSLSHQIWKDLSTSLQAGIRGDDQLEIQSSKKTAYNAMASLSYSFLRYYALSLRYSYRQVGAELRSGEYTTQQVYLALSAANELFRW